MKNILVTGGAGFIGSHLVETLLERGDRVSVVDNESTGSFDNLAAVADHPYLTYKKASVTEPDVVREMLVGVDEVYHLAAAVGVALIAKAPIHTIETNIYPTELILSELGRLQEQGQLTKLFLASTSEVYGKNPAQIWTEEDDLVFGATNRPRWSYGTSKAIDEFLALAYWREHELPVVVARFFNVVGPRQSPAYGMVLPRFIEAALAGKNPTVHDDGHQVRCFAHVSDIIRSVLELMDIPSAVGQIFNVGSDEPIEILDLAKKVIAATDPKLGVDFISYAEAYQDDFEDCRHRVPDLSRLRHTINVEPRYNLDRVIAELVEISGQK